MTTDITPQALTPERLAEIAARAQAATPGPWCTDAWEIYQGAEYMPGLSMWIGETCRGTSTPEQDRADAAFVAAARTDVPALLARVAELEAEREKLVRWHGEDSKTINRLVARVQRRRAELVALRNDALSMRGSLSPNGEDRKVPFPLGETLTPAVDWLIAEVERLQTERHSTNEALDDAVRALREMRDRTSESYPGELAMLRGLVATLRAVTKHGDLADVVLLLDEHQRDEQDAYALTGQADAAGYPPALPWAHTMPDDEGLSGPCDCGEGAVHYTAADCPQTGGVR